MHIERSINNYELSTWTLSISNELFFYKSRPQTQQQVFLHDVALSKYAKQTRVWVPRAKVHMDGELELRIVEDIAQTLPETCETKSTASDCGCDFVGLS